MNIKDIVKNQNAHFVFYRDRSLFYETDKGFQFPVPIDDAGLRYAEPGGEGHPVNAVYS